MTVYVYIRNQQCRTYGSLTKLCEAEGLGYSKFSKFFARNTYYRSWSFEIYRTELQRKSNS